MKRDDDYDDGDIDDDDDDNGVYITNTEYKCECFFSNGHILSLHTNLLRYDMLCKYTTLSLIRTVALDRVL